MKKISTNSITKMAIFLALLVTLELLESSFFRMAQGGSISISSFFFIITALFLTWKEGSVVFILWRVLTLILVPPFIVSPLQFILDYFIAYGGFIGTYFLYKSNKLPMVLVSIIIANAFRYLIHVLTGVLYFGEYAEGPVLSYSLIYNGSYMLPTVIAQIVLAIALAPITKGLLNKTNAYVEETK